MWNLRMEEVLVPSDAGSLDDDARGADYERPRHPVKDERDEGECGKADGGLCAWVLQDLHDSDLR